MKIPTRFWTTSHLTANNFGMEQDVVNRKSALKTINTRYGRYNCEYFCPLTNKLLAVVLTHPILVTAALLIALLHGLHSCAICHHRTNCEEETIIIGSSPQTGNVAKKRV